MGKPRVLIVDDDVVARRSATRMLSEFCEVEEAQDGLAALRAIEDRQFDLVLSDLDMPNMDGDVLLSESVRSGRLGPSNFVFMSGDSLGLKARTLAGAGLLVLAKPAALASLPQVVSGRLSAPVLTGPPRVAKILV